MELARIEDTIDGPEDHSTPSTPDTCRMVVTANKRKRRRKSCPIKNMLDYAFVEVDQVLKLPHNGTDIMAEVCEDYTIHDTSEYNRYFQSVEEWVKYHAGPLPEKTSKETAWSMITIVYCEKLENGEEVKSEFNGLDALNAFNDWRKSRGTVANRSEDFDDPTAVHISRTEAPQFAYPQQSYTSGGGPIIDDSIINFVDSIVGQAQHEDSKLPQRSWKQRCNLYLKYFKSTAGMLSFTVRQLKEAQDNASKLNNACNNLTGMLQDVIYRYSGGTNTMGDIVITSINHTTSEQSGTVLSRHMIEEPPTNFVSQLNAAVGCGMDTTTTMPSFSASL